MIKVVMMKMMKWKKRESQLQ